MSSSTYLPRSEYPRPDRQRAFVHGVDWLNLNGPWEFRFDGQKRGLEDRWFMPGISRWTEQIIVPFCWESLAAWSEADAAGNDNFYASRVYRNPLEVTRFNYRDAERFEVGWYRRTIVLPDNEHWNGKRVILTIGAADFFTDCWCNGRHLGRNENGYIPFEFDLTDALDRTPDGLLTATVVLRVKDPMDNREQPVGKQWGWYSTVSGIWQTVFVEPRSSIFIERFEVTTDLDARTVNLKVFTHGGERLLVKVRAPDGREFGDEFPVTSGLATGAISVDPVFLWDPTNPQLYDLTLTLENGAPADVLQSYFGMRSLSAKEMGEIGVPAALCLNGEAIYIRGALYQSYFADGIYTAGDVQVLKDDIAYAKRAGFDLLRIHLKVDDPLLLYYADTLGILLMADFPNFGEGGDTPLGRQRYEETMRATIQRDFNHPSIIAWCLFNETWGFGGQSEFVKLINPKPPLLATEASTTAPGTKLANLDASTWVETMWRRAKSLDPSRLIEDMSVVAWEHLQYYGHGQTDINSWHFYTDDYEKARTSIHDVVEQTYSGSSFNYVPGFKQGSQPLINSEYGGVGALDGDVDISWSFKFLTNELRRYGKLSAYIFTELHDVEWERNGFLNYDRTPKEFGYDPTIVNQGDVLPIDAPPISKRRPGEEVEIEVFSSHFARRGRENVNLYWRLSGVDSMGWVHDDLESGSKPIPFSHYRTELAHRLRLRMPDRTMICRVWVRAVTPDGALLARNYVQFFVDGGSAAYEQSDEALVLRAEPHAYSAVRWTGESSGATEAKTLGYAHATGQGYFEWWLPVRDEHVGKLSRIRVLCEASARREGTPQTDFFAHPTTFRMLLNDVRVYEGLLPNHPHDAAGALSYLRGGRGAYGYLIHATVEGELLGQVIANAHTGGIRLRCEVPPDAAHVGGLTIYGGDCGRFPVPPTLILESNGSVPGVIKP
ncbi:MAG: sugar-binding domain-containing protein [Chthoniobacterales bacterium]